MISNATDALASQTKKAEKPSASPGTGWADSLLNPAEEGKSTPHKDGSNSGGGGPRSGGSVVSTAPQPIRKDPNEEFFMMTFLSYKLNHQQYDKILKVSPSFYLYIKISIQILTPLITI